MPRARSSPRVEAAIAAGAAAASLRRDLLELAPRFNVADEREALVLPLEYLEVVATVTG